MTQFKGLFSKQRQDRADGAVSKCRPLPLSIKILAWLNVSSWGCGEVGWGGWEGGNWRLDRSLPFPSPAPSPNPPTHPHTHPHTRHEKWERRLIEKILRSLYLEEDKVDIC